MNETKIPFNQSDLNSSYSEELRNELQRWHKTELIIKILKQQSPVSVDERALLSMYKYDHPLPLGLDRIRNVELNYHNRMKLIEHVEVRLAAIVKPMVDKVSKLTNNNLSNLANLAFKDYSQMLEIESEKRKLMEELIKLKNRRLHFMNLCAEMRTGPYQKNNVEAKNAESRALHIKAETIQKVMVHEVITSTAHAVKAVKEVEANIDTLLCLK